MTAALFDAANYQFSFYAGPTLLTAVGVLLLALIVLTGGAVLVRERLISADGADAQALFQHAAQRAGQDLPMSSPPPSANTPHARVDGVAT